METRTHTLILDVDQTLNGGLVPVHMEFYNPALGLGMTPEEVAATEQFPSTFTVPQIEQFRAQGPEAEAQFQAVRTQIRTSEQVHLNFPPMPEAPEMVRAMIAPQGISQADKFVLGGYYTVRPPVLQNVTEEWLRRNGFPQVEGQPGQEARNVVICDTPQHKLEQIIADHILVPNRPSSHGVVLIDDGLDKLIEAAQQLVTEKPDMQPAMEQLTIVGFGLSPEWEVMHGTIRPDIGLHTLTLPSWQREDVVHMVQRLPRPQQRP